MATRIQVRRDTLANWNSFNPTLSSGEIAFITDQNKIKIGDGSTAFSSLGYLEADAFIDSVALGTDTTGNYVETLIASDGISISGEGAESASVTLTNTGVLSLAGTTNEIDVSASSGNITLSLPTSITVDLVGDVTGNADTASTLATARTISLGGDLSGSASFDGGSDITINASVNADSVELGVDTTGNYVARLSSSGDGLLVEGSGESASVTLTNTGVTSLSGTASEVEISASTGAVTIGLPSTINADTTGNAATASTLETARTISLTGDVSGSASFNGSADVTITATVADDSHNHIVGDVDGLQSALDLKAPLDSPALTGTPTAPTASASANSTQIATTAFVQTSVANLIDGAPGALDTLNELAASLGDDSDFAGTVTNSLAGKQPLDADLTAIAGLSASATGFLVKDGENAWSLDTNTYLTGNQTITLSGDVSGSGTTSIEVTIADDSHNHIISNIDGLQTALDNKQPIDADLTAIAGLSASATGILTKDAENTWSLDTNTYLTANETITVSGDATGSGTTSISLTLADSGVSASSYGGSTEVPVITVDSKGRLTNVSTAAIVSLPDQTGNSGKYLTTNGSVASWDDVTVDLSGYAALSGATFTGEVDVVSASAAGSTSARQITMSTSSPSGGSNGDLWVQYS